MAFYIQHAYQPKYTYTTFSSNPPSTIESTSDYVTTARGFEELAGNEYPKEFLEKTRLKDKKILDICAGHGGFVLDGILMELDITGLEIKKPSIETCVKNIKRYREGLNSEPFVISPENKTKLNQKLIQGDACNQPFKDNTFDLAYCTWGIFSYEDESLELKTKALQEMTRVIKPNGKIRMAPVSIKEISDIIANPSVPLRIVKNGSFENQRMNFFTPAGWVELERTA